MKHLGDITKIHGAKIEPVDVITFGSPCQDLSVAGKREGLAGERSGLFMEAVRIIKEMRSATDGEYPTFAVWENVPGAFSSNKSEDFRAVLEELVRIVEPGTAIPEPPKGKWNTSGAIMGNGWSLAWRVLDAQFWGVPQRRRRISLVMDLGGQSAREILFVRNGVQRNPASSGKARKRIARDIKKSVGGTGRNVNTLVFNEAQITSPKNGNNPQWNDPCHTLSATDGRAPTVIYEDCASTECYPINLQIATRHKSLGKGTGFGVGDDGEPAYTLQAGHEHGVCAPTYCLQGNMIGRADKNGPQGNGINEDVSFTLNATDRHAVAYGIGAYHSEGMKSPNPHAGIYEAQTSRTLDLNGGNPACNQGGIAICEPEVMHTLDTCSDKIKNYVAVYDARDNGDGNIAPTMTGDHQNRITDYTGICVETYQKVIGPLMANSHPGSYTGQDVYSDMLVTESQCAGIDCRNLTETPELYPTMQAKSQGGWSLNYSHAIRIRYRVRRLTPLECERLQGFPDGWTNIPDYIDDKGKKKSASDSARYKVLGNSIALPPWKWVLKRISAQFEHDATLGSLFDGIGGFPLIWEQLNGRGSARWASEIEAFPIAVTKYWFNYN